MQEVLDRRRARVAAAWDLKDEVVLVVAGEPLSIPGRGDQVYPFRSHSEYFYLTDRERPGSVLAFDPGDGWFDFVPEVSEDERVWEGGGENEGIPIGELKGWLEARQGRPVAMLGAETPARHDEALSERLREVFTHARRPKDEVELERMRAAAQASAAGFQAVQPFLRAGLTERQVQIELEAAFFRAGADRTAYDTIVGSGPNAAVLHFPPSDRRMRSGELVLIDAGGEVQGYASDVTRTYGVEGLAGIGGDLYNVVLAAEKAAVAKCRPGKEYRDIHLEAALDLTRGLVDLGILHGEPEGLVEQEAQALFFPHGIGHMVGLGVRDASGYLPGRARSESATLRFLRVDLPLEAGYAVTIEPGLYFIPALLQDRKRRERYRDQVNWERVDGLLALGGVRIEDNVVVTAEGEPEVLTAAIPK